MTQAKFIAAYIFNLLWLLGLLHIGYYGSKPYPHYISDEMISPDFQAMLMACAIYSLYFICGNVLRLIPFWRNMPYWAYTLLSAILIFQCFAAFIGAMHAPPYWGALIISCMFTLLAHFVFYPIYALCQKYAQKKNTAS
ncbi:hypothetical protein [Acinetobacter sp. ANC 3813]|uniref:hypothetical protein n=1 Tax=Acinetobacter sp. ANC 3813 TaxID=1977873 RepID=UPI000A35385D|nr:hypothetical protein [Acinetobacter sp. ANC 3813]OTG86038.1 hypothetical protein B9T34_18280 [Acinetobacter sp. ANC 3813]